MDLASDVAATASRFAQLCDYLTQHVLDLEGSFVCASEEECRYSALMVRATGRCKPNRLFSVGQLSHVGHHYDLTQAGHALRILVIPMDTGGTNERVTLENRREEIATSAALPYRSRNPHMRGTTHALRLAVGRELGEGRSGEMLDLTGESTQVHLFDCYAMANIRLCSATESGKSESKGTPTMSRNCLRHLNATVKILEPTLCIIRSLQVASGIAPLIERRERITASLEWVHLAGIDTLLATFTHPSAQNVAQTWGRLTSAPYLWNVVQPTIRRARRELGLPSGQTD